MAFDPKTAIDIREFKKNSRPTNQQSLSFKNMKFEANKVYHVADLPDDIIIQNIYYYATNMLKNGGTTADPTTLRAKYISETSKELAEIEKKYYKNIGSIFIDVGAAEHSGAVVIEYLHAGIVLGPYA